MTTAVIPPKKEKLFFKDFYRWPARVCAALAEDERRAREAGFDAHLVKPAEFVKLRALLRSAARAAA